MMSCTVSVLVFLMPLTKKAVTRLVSAVVAFAGVCAPVNAHFQVIKPSLEIVSSSAERVIDLDVFFTHPFQGLGLDMKKPVQFGVFSGGKKHDLLNTLKQTSFKDVEGSSIKAFKTSHRIKSPGDHIFYVQPQPYWEEAEETHIVHHTKTVVNAFGVEEGWDQEIGLKAEIIPLTRPYAIWSGNVFRGLVKVNGKPVANTIVEIELLDGGKKVKAPSEPFITQTVKTDANGVFTYGIPHGGWWGFAALVEDEKTMAHGNKQYPVELGAVLWIKARDMNNYQR